MTSIPRLLGFVLAALALTACSSSGGSYHPGNTHMGVYYGYPYYGPGWGVYPYPCCDHHPPGKPDRPNKPVQPVNPRPLPGRPITTPGVPSRPRPPVNIGRPAIRPMPRMRRR